MAGGGAPATVGAHVPPAAVGAHVVIFGDVGCGGLVGDGGGPDTEGGDVSAGGGGFGPDAACASVHLGVNATMKTSTIAHAC